MYNIVKVVLLTDYTAELSIHIVRSLAFSLSVLLLLLLLFHKYGCPIYTYPHFQCYRYLNNTT